MASPAASSVPILPMAPVTSSITNVTDLRIASIPKLGRNAMPGYYQMNGTWQCMIGEVPQPTKPSENNPKVTTQYETDLAKRNTMCDALEGALRPTITGDPMFHVHGLSNCSSMWKKFQTLYGNTSFLERDAIFIRPSTKAIEDFQRIAEFANAIKKDATRLKEIGITDLPSWIHTTWLLHELSSEYNGVKMMLNNNQRAIESRREKKELNFDSVLEQLLSMSKDSLALHNSRSLKTSAPKPKDKGKSYSNETSSYCSKPGHNDRSCYYKYPEKGGDTFRERNKDKIAKLRRATGYKNARERPGNPGLRNAQGFVTQSSTYATSPPKDNEWYFDDTAPFHMTGDLADFEDQDLMQSHKDDTILSAFGQEERPRGIGRVCYNVVVDGVSEPYYLDDVHWCPYLNTKLISLDLLDQKRLTYSAYQSQLRVQWGNRTVMTGAKNDNNLYSVNLEPLPALRDGKTWAYISKQTFGHLNETSVRHLPNTTKGMKTSFFKAPKLPPCEPYIKGKMTRQLRRKPQVRTTRPGYRQPHANLESIRPGQDIVFTLM